MDISEAVALHVLRREGAEQSRAVWACTCGWVVSIPLHGIPRQRLVAEATHSDHVRQVTYGMMGDEAAWDQARDRMKSRLDAVLTLHADDGSGWCRHCSIAAPCPTSLAALDGVPTKPRDQWWEVAMAQTATISRLEARIERALLASAPKAHDRDLDAQVVHAMRRALTED